MAAARRYMARIRFLKIVLPLAALVSLSLVFLLAKEIPLNANAIYLDKRKTDIENAREMLTPRYQGVSEAGWPISFSARSTFTKTVEADLIEAISPRFMVTDDEQRSLRGWGATGAYAPSEGTVTLDGNATLTRSDGFRMRSDAILYDLNDNSVFTHTPMDGLMPFGTVRSDTVTINLGQEGGGMTGQFKGNVRVVYTPDQGEGS